MPEAASGLASTRTDAHLLDGLVTLPLAFTPEAPLLPSTEPPLPRGRTNFYLVTTPSYCQCTDLKGYP